MPSAKVEKEIWSDDHSATLMRGMINLILSNRSALYSLPGLEGVSENGGDRINKKLQQTLKKMCATTQVPGGGSMVEEELGKMKRSSGGGGGGGTPKKGKSGGGGSVGSPTPSPKKRKVKSEDLESE